jgi:hypothetical protein
MSQHNEAYLGVTLLVRALHSHQQPPARNIPCLVNMCACHTACPCLCLHLWYLHPEKQSLRKGSRRKSSLRGITCVCKCVRVGDLRQAWAEFLLSLHTAPTATMAAMMFKSGMAVRGAQRPAVAKHNSAVVVRAAREMWYPGVQSSSNAGGSEASSTPEDAAWQQAAWMKDRTPVLDRRFTAIQCIQ